MVEVRGPGGPQLRDLLSAALRRRIPSAGRYRVDDRRFRAGLRHRSVVGDLPPAPDRADDRGRVLRPRRIGAAARSERARPRPHRRSRGIRSDRRHGDRDRTPEPMAFAGASADAGRMAARHGRRDAAPVRVLRRAAAERRRDADRGLPLSRSRRNGVGLRMLVPRRGTALAGLLDAHRRDQSDRRDRARRRVRRRARLARPRLRHRARARSDRAGSERTREREGG